MLLCSGEGREGIVSDADWLAEFVVTPHVVKQTCRSILSDKTSEISTQTVSGRALLENLHVRWTRDTTTFLLYSYVH